MQPESPIVIPTPGAEDVLASWLRLCRQYPFGPEPRPEVTMLPPRA